MSDAGSAQDSFTAGRANIRETVKWLVAAFAALAAVIVGTSPFTAFGRLDRPFLALAIASGLLGIAFVFWAINTALDVLVTPTFFLGDIRKDDRLVKLIGDHSGDLLPPRIDSLPQFLDRRAELLKDLTTEKDPDKLKLLQQNYTTLQNVATRLISLSNYENLRSKFEEARLKLFLLAVVAALSLGTFAWATTHMNPDDKPPTQVFCGTAQHPAGAAPARPAAARPPDFR